MRSPFPRWEASAGYGKDFLARRELSHVQEMGFLVDGRSVIGVSNSAAQPPDYKDANVPVEKFRQRRRNESSREDKRGRRKLVN